MYERAEVVKAAQLRAGGLIHVESAVDFDHHAMNAHVGSVALSRNHGAAERTVHLDAETAAGKDIHRCMGKPPRGVPFIASDADVGTVRRLVQITRQRLGRKAMPIDDQAPFRVREDSFDGARQGAVVRLI